MFAPRSAYLHIPFCHRRCFYCDFAVVPLGDQASAIDGAPGSRSIAAYVTLLQREITASPGGPPLSTVYLGGGTPSLLSASQLADLLGTLRHRYGLSPAAEVTLELDPASFDQHHLQACLAAGITRVSLGGQSFDDGVLQRLGRRHSSRDLRTAIDWLCVAQQQGELASWSLDLIQAVPGQTRRDWSQQLQLAINSGAPHLSIYELTLEPGTVFGRQAERGQLALPDDDLAADLLELTSATLVAAGYGHYEISNYAKPGHSSRHNRVYWSGADWWGFGMGATSCQRGTRQARPRQRDAYAAWVDTLERHLHQPNRSDPQPPAGALALDDRLLVGLRRREGVVMAALLQQAGLSDPEAQLADLQALLAPERAAGLVLIEGNRWRLSDPHGLGLSNAVLRTLLTWWERADRSPTAAMPAAPVDADQPAAWQTAAGAR